MQDEQVAQRTRELIAAMQAAGLKRTPQRLALARLLAADRSHPTALELAERVRAEHPTMSVATVYNTLQVLKRLGQVIELRLGDGPCRYDGRTVQPHAHAICTVCGRIIDVEGVQGPNPDGALPDGFHLSAARVEFLGECAQCHQAAPQVS
jgi:Fur family peroxide stress response transcriptional regulator